MVLHEAADEVVAVVVSVLPQRKARNKYGDRRHQRALGEQGWGREGGGGGSGQGWDRVGTGGVNQAWLASG